MHRIRGALHDTFRSLGIRNFRLFFGGQLVSQVGNWLTLVAQVLLVLHLTDNNGVAVGVLTACQFLPVLVLGAWAGLVADRVDKRRLLIATHLRDGPVIRARRPRLHAPPAARGDLRGGDAGRHR
jgi:hypothetical protein